MFLKGFNPVFSYIGAWFTDQTYDPLEIEDKINITLISNCSVRYKNDTLFN